MRFWKLSHLKLWFLLSMRSCISRQWIPRNLSGVFGSHRKFWSSRQKSYVFLAPPLPGQLSLVSRPLLSRFFLDFQDKYLESLCSSNILAFDAEGTGFWLEEKSKNQSQWRSKTRQLVSASPASPVLPGQEWGSVSCWSLLLPPVRLAGDMRLKADFLLGITAQPTSSRKPSDKDNGWHPGPWEGVWRSRAEWLTPASSQNIPRSAFLNAELTPWQTTILPRGGRLAAES